MTDATIFLQWYGMYFVLGTVFLPLTVLVFSPLSDKGYIFAKVLGSLLISYAIFVLATIKMVPFSTFSLFGLLIFFLILNIVLLIKYNLSNILFAKWKIFLTQEILFLATLALWSYIRAHEPSINGLEKFMDYGFVNSILRATYFPPIDMWFPPFPINYYYFGHLVTAVLTKLSALPSNYTYNLMIASLFAFTFTASFSLGYNLLQKLKMTIRKSVITGILAGLLVSVGGNLHTIYALFTAYTPPENPVPFWQLAFKPLEMFSTNGYWYPNATRFIPNTIHEFPIYSFVVSDLHGHVLDIPVVLMFLSFMFTLLIRKSISILLLVCTGFFLACMYMTNVLDFGIYFLLTIGILGYLLIKQLKIVKRKKAYTVLKFIPVRIKRINNLSHILFTGAKYGIVITLSTVAVSLPFSVFFKPFASGIGILCAPKFLTAQEKIGPFLFEANHCERSEWWMLLVLYGFFFFFITVLFVYLWKNREEAHRAPFAFALIVTLLSVMLILIPEFAYIKDIYPQHYRANTMFKLTYQAFMMLSLVSAFVIGGVIKPTHHKFVTLVTILLLSLVLVYPRFAVYSYYNSLTEYVGLDGTAYLKDRYPDDYSAIQWIEKNISGQPVILESQGDSYTDHERVSANTGLPTVLGWTVHEWLWRGTYDIPAPRITDVQNLYESTDITQTRTLLEKYNVEYVYIGNLEREKYPALNEEKFKTLGDAVYQNNTVTIYKITL